MAQRVRVRGQRARAVLHDTKLARRARVRPWRGDAARPRPQQRSRHAVELGCAGVLMLPPFYYKGVSDEGLYRGFSEVVERVGDARLRIYLYHIPPVAQVSIGLDLIERLVKRYPDTVVGLKDSSGDWDNTRAVLDGFPGFATFAGSFAFALGVTPSSVFAATAGASARE